MFTHLLRIVSLCFVSVMPSQGIATASDEIEASAQYILGDNDSKLDGRRLALLEAKRNALEKAGTYIESFSEVQNFQLTKDQVRSYAAGILEVKETGEKWDMIGQNMAVTLAVKVRVDKDAVSKALAAIQKNAGTAWALEDAQAKIREYERQIEQLNRDLKVVHGTTAEGKKEARSKAIRDVEVEGLVTNAYAALVRDGKGTSILWVGTSTPEARKEAMTILEQASRLNPEHPQVLTMRGILAVEDKDYLNAATLFRKAIARQPDLVGAHVNLGIALNASGDRAGAIRALREAIRLQPGWGHLHVVLGQVYREDGNLLSAAQSLREAIRLQPNHWQAHYVLGYVLREQGDEAGALRAFYGSCQALAPNSPDCAKIRESLKARGVLP